MAGLYVGCGLTHAPELFAEQVESFKNAIREEGHEVYDFVGLTDGTPQDVYEWDLRCVRRCDALIGVIDYPATGLGMEVNEALHLQTPTLLVAHEDSKVSRMLIGMADTEPTVGLIRYRDLIRDVIPVLGGLIRKKA